MSHRAVLFPTVPTDPISFWRLVHPNPGAGFFLGPATKSHPVAYLSVEEPVRVLRSGRDPLQKIRSAIGRSHEQGRVPRFVGFLGFEAARRFDAGLRRLPARPNPLGTPDVFFGDYAAVLRLDYHRGETVLFLRRARGASALVRRISAALEADPRSRFDRSRRAFRLRHLHVAAWSRQVKEAKRAIAAGHIYQANLSFRFETPFQGDPRHLYSILRESNPSPYACLLAFDGRWLISSSPELLLRVDGRRAVTRPIAGTRPRGRTAIQDRRRQGQLLLSPKERAEHVMLVDLERNDLGRVCVPGSVRVTERYAIERYSHVMHIVSEVEGRLARRQTSVDAVRALFPGGTITGCPKIEAVKRIEALEKIARGPFYGSAGYFAGNGDASFNILIRTALAQQGRLVWQAGAGIVADSDPRREYREVLAKAQALKEATQRA